MTLGPIDRDALRRELVALIADSAPDLDGALVDDTPLISSGLVESAALLSVALWVERHIDSAVQITAFDLAAEWETVADILTFVKMHRP